jgi:hypothetical protein
MKTIDFITALQEVNAATMNNESALIQTHALRRLMSACEDRITELSDNAIQEATVILRGVEHKSQGEFTCHQQDGTPRLFQLQITEKYDFSKSEKYTDKQCQDWRAVKREQDALKRQSSAMTKQLNGIVEAYIAAHPRTTPDEVKPILKCITKIEK